MKFSRAAGRKCQHRADFIELKRALVDEDLNGRPIGGEHRVSPQLSPTQEENVMIVTHIVPQA